MDIAPSFGFLLILGSACLFLLALAGNRLAPRLWINRDESIGMAVAIASVAAGSAGAAALAAPLLDRPLMQSGEVAWLLATVAVAIVVIVAAVLAVRADLRAMRPANDTAAPPSATPPLQRAA